MGNIRVIRFIMNNKGVSLVETIIAAAILSVMLIPVLAGFSQSFKNYNASYNYYMASVEVSNIMMEISTALSSGVDVWELPEVNDCSIEGFQYSVYIGRILGDSLYDWASYSSGDILPIPNVTIVSGEHAYNAEGYILVVDIYKGEDALVKRMVQPIWI